MNRAGRIGKRLRAQAGIVAERNPQGNRPRFSSTPQRVSNRTAEGYRERPTTRNSSTPSATPAKAWKARDLLSHRLVTRTSEGDSTDQRCWRPPTGNGWGPFQHPQSGGFFRGSFLGTIFGSAKIPSVSRKQVFPSEGRNRGRARPGVGPEELRKRKTVARIPISSGQALSSRPIRGEDRQRRGGFRLSV